MKLNIENTEEIRKIDDIREMLETGNIGKKEEMIETGDRGEIGEIGEIGAKKETIDIASKRSLGEIDDERVTIDIEGKIDPGEISDEKEEDKADKEYSADTGDIGEGKSGSCSLPFTPVSVYSLVDGIYNSARKIGDNIEKHYVIGKIENKNGDNVQIIAPVKGRIVANALSGGHFEIGDELLVIDPSGIAKEDCFRTMPIDKTVAYSVLFLLEKSKLDNSTKNSNIV